nr:12002_t:CDS:2 [Entrophospora candida]
MPRLSNCKQQVATRQRNKNGHFSELQEQQPELIENVDGQMQKVLEEGDLNDHCKISKSNNSYGAYEHIQLLSLSQYCQLCLNGMGKMDASLQVAKNFWRKGDYMSHCIRARENYFFHNGKLPDHQPDNNINEFFEIETIENYCA